jgi:hypothetical protein
MALKEGAFRNGWFLAAGGLASQPLHVELLTQAGVSVDEMMEVGREALLSGGKDGGRDGDVEVREEEPGANAR